MSGIGGMVNTQEVIDLCAKHSIYPEIKVVPVWEINSVYQKLDSENKTGLRYVLDPRTPERGCSNRFKKLRSTNGTFPYSLHFGRRCKRDLLGPLLL